MTVPPEIQGLRLYLTGMLDTGKRRGGRKKLSKSSRKKNKVIEIPGLPPKHTPARLRGWRVIGGGKSS